MNRKPKVLFVNPNLGAGGAERVMSILAKSLSQRGYRVEFILFNDLDRAYTIDESVKVHVLLERTLRSIPDRVKILLKLRRILARNKGAVVIPFHPSCHKYVMAANIDRAVRVVSMENNDPGNLYTPERLKEMDRLYARSDYSVFQTEDARSYFCDAVKGNSSVIPNPVPSPDETWHGDIARKRIITLCRLEKQKNLFMALDAVRILIDQYGITPSFDIFGQGSLEKELKEYCTNLGISQYVRFMGTTHQTTREMAAASVFILSSDYEGISNSMLEALAVGIPVVCTDCPVGGARMAIHSGENGLLVPVGDANALAAGVAAVLSDEKLAMRIGANARISGETHFSVDRVTDQWEEVIRKACREE